MKVGAKTDQGLVREHNEDAFGYHDHLFVVADGMGGHCAGEVASSIATETILGWDFNNQETVETNLKNAVLRANQAILDAVTANLELVGMGTTVAVLYLTPEQAYFTHVGDSRIYHIISGSLEQLTSDHSLVAELVRNGGITEDEAKKHPQRNILTRALGSQEPLEIEVQAVAIKSGERFLICSDGLYNLVNEDILSQLLGSPAEPQDCAEKLIAAALENGGNDNITAIVIEI